MAFDSLPKTSLTREPADPTQPGSPEDAQGETPPQDWKRIGCLPNDLQRIVRQQAKHGWTLEDTVPHPEEAGMIVARFRRDAKPEKPQTELRRRSRPKPSRGGKRSIQAQNEFLCLPSSILSSGFDIAGRGHRAKLFFSWLVEQGSLETDGQHYEIRKQGPLSGTWTLMAGNRGIAVARKTSPFTRSVQLSGPMGKLELRPTSALSRNFDLIRGDRLVASIRPEHPFTRRSRLTVYAPDADFPTLCFAFWLVALAWRRAEQS